MRQARIHSADSGLLEEKTQRPNMALKRLKQWHNGEEGTMTMTVWQEEPASPARESEQGFPESWGCTNSRIG